MHAGSSFTCKSAILSKIKDSSIQNQKRKIEKKEKKRKKQGKNN